VTPMRSAAGARASGQTAPRDDALALLAGVAHDLRSPLTSILYLVESLQGSQSGALSTLQRRQLALVYGATYQLSMLVNDLTELAHDGGLSLLERDPIPFSLSAIVESVYDLVRPVAEERKIPLRLESNVTDRRLGHPAALTRVLLNLVTNALRVTAKGYVKIRLAARAAERIAFSVIDTGPGIAPEAMVTLFEPFPNASWRGISSSGLGLAICRSLVQAMGGELTVKSRLGAGASFQFAIALPVV
jgi:two-component system capsular synthesis sensor histidine kinase RcsC